MGNPGENNFLAEQADMNGKLFFRTVLIFMTLFTTRLSAAPKYGGGQGRANNPYKIETVAHLIELRQNPGDWGSHFLLTADLDLDPNLPGGTIYQTAFLAFDTYNLNNGEFDGSHFVGYIDGASHVIRNLVIDANGTGNDFLGFIGSMQGGEIKNLGLENVQITANNSQSYYVGGLIGKKGDVDTPRGVVNQCYVTGVVSGERYVGGFVGFNRGDISQSYAGVNVNGDLWVGGFAGYQGSGLIEGCHAEGNVIGRERVGGFIGQNGLTEYQGAELIRCYAAGNVLSQPPGDYLGGLVGWHRESAIRQCYARGNVSGGTSSDRVGALIGEAQDSDLEDCYSRGDVTGVWAVGGLLGANTRNKLFRCYSTGSVTGSSETGGLVGYSPGFFNTPYYLCYWDTESSGIAVSAAGVGKTHLEMMERATYRGWGDNLWSLNDGNDCPTFVWEGEPGVAIVDPPFSYSGGTGVAGDPFQIAEANDLEALTYRSRDWDKHFMLISDINMEGYRENWHNRIIGTPSYPFTGVFDGNDRTISGVSIDGNNCYIGLFGYVRGSGEADSNSIVDLILSAPDISGQYYVGSVAGYLENAVCSALIVSGCKINGTMFLGGLTGKAEGGSFYRCRIDGSITGKTRSGMLAGSNSAKISQSSTTGTIKNQVGALLNTAGGLVGEHFDAPIFDSYSLVSLAGANISNHNGGLLGRNENGFIARCFSAGLVPDQYDSGGLVGTSKDAATVYLGFWDTETSGLTRSSGGAGKTTAEMTNPTTFQGWGDNVWAISEDSYPHLLWEDPNGQVIIDTPPTYGGGTGQLNSPYQIQDSNDWSRLTLYPQDWGKHFVLADDINMSSHSADYHNRVIGNTWISFTGTLDGNDHTISGISIEGKSGNCGLFGFVDCNSNPQQVVFQNLTIIEPNVAGLDNTGCLAGFIVNGHLRDIFIVDATVSGSENVGGLAGQTKDCTIERCFSGTNLGFSKAVYGSLKAGGLIGSSLDGSITDCYSNTRGITNRYSQVYIGGLIGSNVGADITYCDANATFVFGQTCSRVGGLLGYSADGNISDCSAALDLRGGWGSSRMGGLIGEHDFKQISIDITNCHADFSIELDDNLNYVGGLVGTCHGVSGIYNCSSEGNMVFGDSAYLAGGFIGDGICLLKECSSVCDIIGGHDAFGIGGMAGKFYSRLEDCYVHGNVSVADNCYAVGGLVGSNYASTERCYVVCPVSNGSGGGSIGAVIGSDSSSSLQCFWDADVSGITDGVGNKDPDPTGVTGLTTAEMKIQSTYTDAGWDFVDETANGTEDIWSICEVTDYPRLTWQRPIGDMICPYGVDLIDLEFFVQYWLQSNCAKNDDCYGTDLDISGEVNFADFAYLAENWLSGI